MPSCTTVCTGLNLTVSTNGNPQFRAATSQTHQVKNICVCMDACLCVCVCALKGPHGVGTSGFISRHLVFAQILLSHAVSARLTLTLFSFFRSVSCCYRRTQGKISIATILQYQHRIQTVWSVNQKGSNLTLIPVLSINPSAGRSKVRLCYRIAAVRDTVSCTSAQWMLLTMTSQST